MPAGQPPAAPLQVQVPAETCAWTELEPTTLGTVRGRLVDAQGRSAAGRWIFLAPVSDLPAGSFAVPSDTAVATDGEGRWAIGLVPQGEYILLVNRGAGETEPLLPPVFFPGTREREKAGRVRVEVSKETKVADFRLPPPLVPRRVSGVLRWSDGRPADGVRVSLRETGVETNVMTDTDGSFELTGFEGRAYELLAACKREGGVLETEPRKLKPGKGEIRLDLKL